MSEDKVFLDTNLWIYFYAVNEPEKQAKVTSLIKENLSNVIISTQVLSEMYNVLTRKKMKSAEEAQEIITQLIVTFNIVPVMKNTIQKAFEIINITKFSYWDSLIISAALINESKILYSEDLHHKQIIENRLQIINPFK